MSVEFVDTNILIYAHDGGHRLGLLFWPRRYILPDARVFATLWMSQVAPLVPIFQFQLAQFLEMFLECMADERGPVHLLPLRSLVGGLQKPCIEDYLDGLHCR